MISEMSGQFHIQLHPLLAILSGWKLLEWERAASSSPRRGRSSKKKKRKEKKPSNVSLLSLSFTSLHYKQKLFVFALLLGNRCHNRQTNRLKNISRHWPLLTGLQLRIFSHAPAYLNLPTIPFEAIFSWSAVMDFLEIFAHELNSWHCDKMTQQFKFLTVWNRP